MFNLDIKPFVVAAPQYMFYTV